MHKILIALTLLFIYSCSNDQVEESQKHIGGQLARPGSHEIEEFYDQEVEMEPPRTAEPNDENPQFTLSPGSKIIKTGNLNFEVSNLNEAKMLLDTLVDQSNAHYENEQYSAFGDRISYNLVIRIPNLNFENLISRLEIDIGDLKHKNININDLTEDYVDVKIRLDNNTAYLKQYRSLLVKAKSIKDILDIQEKIRRLEEEIDSKKGRLQYIDDRSKYSTLNIGITELIMRDFAKKPAFARRVGNAFKDGITGTLNFMVALVGLWPLFALILLGWIFRKKISSIFKKR